MGTKSIDRLRYANDRAGHVSRGLRLLLVLLALMALVAGGCGGGPRVTSTVGAFGDSLVSSGSKLMVDPVKSETSGTLGNGVVDAGAWVKILPADAYVLTEDDHDVIDSGARVMFFPAGGGPERYDEATGEGFVPDMSYGLVVVTGSEGIVSRGTALVDAGATVRVRPVDIVSRRTPKLMEVPARVHFIPSGDGVESDGNGVIVVSPEGVAGVFVIVPEADFVEEFLAEAY